MMNPQFSRSEIREAAEFISGKTTLVPRAGLILGSGLSDLVASIGQATRIPYASIPHFVPSTVEGHPGELVIGLLDDFPVLAMRGRAHMYEGYSPQQVTFPVRAMWGMSVKYLIITNAAGALNPAYRAGDLMLIGDHIGLPNMVGLNPLYGPNDPTIGPRFPDMSRVYDRELRGWAVEDGRRLNLPLHQGVYVMVSGPSFETPADLRFLRIIGADAVGMSTVPEATVAHHAGMRVLGISGISNALPAEPGAAALTHEEVLEAGQVIVSRMAPLIRSILRRLV